MARHDAHLTWNDLAALVDRGAESAAAGQLAHLAACPACLAAWSAAVEERDRGLAAAPVEVAAQRRPVLASRSRRRPARTFAWGLGSLAAAAVLLLALTPRELSDPPAERAGDGPELRLQQRLSNLSHHGLVFPRVAVLGSAPIADYRAGVTNGQAIDLSDWAARFDADPGDAAAAFWLAAGLLARGQLDRADDVLRRALKRSPQATDLRQLVAIAAYQRSDLAGAAAALRAILRDEPGNKLAQLNLAIIDHEAGDRAAARAALEACAGDPTQPAAQARARQLLQESDIR